MWLKKFCGYSAFYYKAVKTKLLHVHPDLDEGKFLQSTNEYILYAM